LADGICGTDATVAQRRLGSYCARISELAPAPERGRAGSENSVNGAFTEGRISRRPMASVLSRPRRVLTRIPQMIGSEIGHRCAPWPNRTAILASCTVRYGDKASLYEVIGGLGKCAWRAAPNCSQ